MVPYKKLAPSSFPSSISHMKNNARFLTSSVSSVTQTTYSTTLTNYTNPITKTSRFLHDSLYIPLHSKPYLSYPIFYFKIQKQTHLQKMILCFINVLKNQPFWVAGLCLFGFIYFFKTCVALLGWVYVSFLRPGKDLKKYGSWALVTGPTDGIGKAFAFELARKGLNLILVGRNVNKLNDISKEIQSKYAKVDTKTVVVDFSGDLDEGVKKIGETIEELDVGVLINNVGVSYPYARFFHEVDDEGVKKIGETIEELDVGVLINNVGVSYPYARFFHEVDDELLKNLIKVNVEGTTKVTKAVLPGMISRKRGAIINIGSGAATVIPSDPLYALYAASKAYIDQFSKCLHVEYKNKGIDVQCQVPLYVATKMASIKRSSFFVPSSTGYARAALRWIGYQPRCTPYWPHSLIWNLIYFLPEFAVDAYRFQFCLGIRKRGQFKDSGKKE